jgi:uncharacterized membrane protein (UPF0127 family)
MRGKSMRHLWLVCLGPALLVSCMAQGEGKAPNRTAAAPSASHSTDPTAKDYVGPALPKAKVVLHDAFGGAHLTEVEVAATEDARTRGLMWRTELAEGKGMLFAFRDVSVKNFWMKNTLIALDMAFISADGTVVGIVSNAEPRTLTSRSVGAPSKYVLEVPGGWMDKIGVSAGSKVDLQGVGMIPVE